MCLEPAPGICLMLAARLQLRAVATGRVRGPIQVRVSALYFVRPEGVCHQWRKDPPGELSIDPVADERLGRATERAEAS
jgi:hypothetical protein